MAQQIEGLQIQLQFFIISPMAKKGNRQNLGLECSVCKSRNYITSKNTMTTKDKLTFKKFCRECRKVTEHNEYKLK